MGGISAIKGNIRVVCGITVWLVHELPASAVYGSGIAKSKRLWLIHSWSLDVLTSSGKQRPCLWRLAVYEGNKITR